jgi:outer membrane protein OmpA-like peptidoglycan-associated protein
MITALLATALAAPEPTAGLFGGVHVAGPEHELYRTPGVQHGPLGPAVLLGVRAGFPVLGPLGLEGELFGGPASRVGGGLLYGFRAHGNVHFPEIADRWTPMFVAGGGYLGLVSRDLGSDLDLAVHLGPAVKVRLSESLNLRTDLRWLLSGRKGVSAQPGGHGQLLVSLSWNLRKRDLDPDGDDIVTELDRCPIETETHNGWKDDDGCPDELATVTITVRDVEEKRMGDMEVRDGNTVLGRTDDQGYLVLEDLMPERVLDLAVDAPEGMMPGARQVTLLEGRNRTTVELGWAPGSLLITASDLDGNPLAAEVTAAGPEMRTWTLGSEGIDELVLKPGIYEIVATYPGYEGHAGEIELSEKSGARAHFDALLKPPADPESVRVEETRLVTLEPIRFEYDSHKVRQSSMAIVDAVARKLNDHPYITKVEVAGHASSEGSDAYNLDLSKRRMVEVKRLLVAKGVDPGRLVAKGYGEDRPAASNETETGRSQNRRVEFNILEKNGGAE